jgi:hypothetical protein
MEFPITDALLSTLMVGLGEDLSHTASNLMLLTTLTYEKSVAYLRTEERWLKHLRAHAAHTSFAAGFSHGAPVPSPTRLPPRDSAPYYLPQQLATALWASGQSVLPNGGGAPRAPAPPVTGGNGRNGGNSGCQRRRGRGGNSGQCNGNPPPPQQSMPPPPWTTGQHPLTRLVHTYTMPVPRAPYPGVLGPRTPAFWGPDQQPTRRSSRRLSMACLQSTPPHPSTMVRPCHHRSTPHFCTPSTPPPTLVLLVAQVTSGSWTAVPPPT